MANVSNTSAITAEDVRHFIFDREIADNPLLLDLAFSDEEIANAMRYCAISYNSITPFVDTRSPENIPSNMAFYHGIIYHLYLSKWSQLIRQDLDYTAGGMTVDQVKRWIDHLLTGIKLHKTEFELMAKERKISINLNSAFGCVG